MQSIGASSRHWGQKCCKDFPTSSQMWFPITDLRATETLKQDVQLCKIVPFGDSEFGKIEHDYSRKGVFGQGFPKAPGEENGKKRDVTLIGWQVTRINFSGWQCKCCKSPNRKLNGECSLSGWTDYRLVACMHGCVQDCSVRLPISPAIPGWWMGWHRYAGRAYESKENCTSVGCIFFTDSVQQNSCFDIRQSWYSQSI